MGDSLAALFSPCCPLIFVFFSSSSFFWRAAIAARVPVGKCRIVLFIHALRHLPWCIYPASTRCHVIGWFHNGLHGPQWAAWVVLRLRLGQLPALRSTAAENRYKSPLSHKCPHPNGTMNPTTDPSSLPLALAHPPPTVCPLPLPSTATPSASQTAMARVLRA